MVICSEVIRKLKIANKNIKVNFVYSIIVLLLRYLLVKLGVIYFTGGRDLNLYTSQSLTWDNHTLKTVNNHYV